MYGIMACLTFLPRGEFSCLTYTLCNHQQLHPTASVCYKPPSPAYEVASGQPLLGEELRVILLLCSGCNRAGAIALCFYGGSPKRSMLPGGKRVRSRYLNLLVKLCSLFCTRNQAKDMKLSETERNLFYFWQRYFLIFFLMFKQKIITIACSFTTF